MALVGLELLPVQPMAATENARTALRTSNFFIEDSGRAGDVIRLTRGEFPSRPRKE